MNDTGLGRSIQQGDAAFWRMRTLLPRGDTMTNEPDSHQPAPKDEAEEMEKVQEDAAKEREETGGYQ